MPIGCRFRARDTPGHGPLVSATLVQVGVFPAHKSALWTPTGSEETGLGPAAFFGAVRGKGGNAERELPAPRRETIARTREPTESLNRKAGSRGNNKTQGDADRSTTAVLGLGGRDNR